ncbi:alpha/beta hydrolase [Hydrogenoanaerobacterium sp.]|uniref:alpha/beta hydrolase n=1 Tax=Hydrogenoanaerobacterium sp. TaxID=2953763 RepID=UPI00289C15D8|nr:alpha/beta hydrolase [Hydrogenoanaerobacterium sp.]
MIRGLKKVKIILVILFGLLILFALTIIIGKIIGAQKYKIRSETGIQKAEYITIGGVEQYIQIRGQDIYNPVIIMLHGGPGNSMAYYSYGWQADLEQDYTIVHWDQRGCGNTYYRNKKVKKPTLDLLLSDLDELVEYICLEYEKETVIIMGHSWGTFLGGIYSGEHPEKVSAYIAISQMLNFKKSEQISAQEAVRLANAAGKTQDAQEISETLELIMAYQKLDKPEATELMKFRQLKEKYLPSQYGDKMVPLLLFSPYMTFNDLKWMLSFDKLIESNSELYEVLFSDGKLSMYDYNLQYEVPVIIIAGDCDWTTPYRMAFSYFNDISAPNKELITIENTGHIPFVDKPKYFSEALLKALSNVLKN